MCSMLPKTSTVCRSLELTAAVTALANVIAKGRSVEELAVLAGIAVQLGDTLATIAAQQSLCDSISKATDG